MSEEQKSAEKSVAEVVEPVDNKAAAELANTISSQSLSGTDEHGSPQVKSNAQSSPEPQQEKSEVEQIDKSEEKPKELT